MSFISRRSFLHFAGVAAAFPALSGISFAKDKPADKDRPNVVFFLVDDMGWSDCGVYGSTFYDTPNVDRLAKQGMLFTDAYAANPLCSPTRASILTGKYPCRLGITAPAGHLKKLPANTPPVGKEAQPWYKAVPATSKRFLPLGEYTIAEAARDAGYKTCFIGKWHLGKDRVYWPEHQGFDVNIAGAGNPGPPSYHSPYRLNNLADGPEGEYVTDRLTDEAVGYLDSDHDSPFMLFLWHFGVHGPWGHKEEITRHYENKKDPRQKQNNPVMASMLKSIDDSLGIVLKKLDELDIAENTVVIFFSDNGGNIHSRIGPGKLPPTNNYPLRGGKANIYEGGSREPLIVRYPGVVKPGSKCSDIVTSVDFYPTLLDICKAKPQQGQVIDGENIMPLLKQTGKLQREAIFCHFPHNTPAPKHLASTYVRKGDWKLIRFYFLADDGNHHYELYNLKDDIGEKTNLSEKYPEKVRHLDNLITNHLKDTNAVIPIPNPRYDPKAKPPTGK